MLIGIALVLVLLNVQPIRSEINSTDDILPAGNPLTFLAGNMHGLKTNLPGIILQNLLSSQSDQSSLPNSYSVGTCLKDLLEILTQLKNRNENALRMIDAWGKLPSGLLTGNFYEFGSFDECFEVQIKRRKTDDYIHPQYCLAKVSIKLENFTLFDQYLENRQTIRLDGFNYFPRMALLQDQSDNSTIPLHIGACIPASCPPMFIETILNAALNELLPSLPITVDVSPEWCQLEMQSTKITAIDITLAAILIVVLCLIIVSTAYDIACTFNGKKKRDGLLVFSAYTNGRKIFSLQRNKSSKTIDCLHGIRAISTAWVIFGHSYYMLALFPLKNKTSFATWVTDFYSTLVTAAPLAVDTFFVLSGFLVTLQLLKHLDKSKGRLNVFALYFHRFLRLTPLYAVVALFESSLIKFFGDGPLWPTLVNDLQARCERDWWKMLLYIHNYFAKDLKICVAQGWYLAVDTQLFVIAPLITYCLYQFKRKFLPIVVLAILASISGAFYTYNYYGDDAVINNAELLYYPTHFRMLTWLVGVILGYFVFDCRNRNVHIPKIINTFGWLASLSCLAAAVLTMHPFMQQENQPSIVDEALYNVFSRLLWAFALIYIIFACVHGYGGPFNWFLSLKVWLPLSRLSFAIYLVHFDILLIINGNLRDALYFSDLFIIHKFLGYYAMAFLVATCASLAFESPIITLEKIIFRSQANSKSDLKTVEPE